MKENKRVELVDLASEPGVELAEVLGVKPDALDAWVRTGRGIPRRAVKWLEFVADAVARRQALAESGISECDWITAFSYPENGSLDELAEADKLARLHQKECSRCRQRNRFLEERFGPPKTPPVGWLGLIVAKTGRVILRVPGPLRPAAVGAAIIGGIVMARLALVLPVLFAGTREAPSILLESGVAFLAAMAAGASGGLVFSLVRPVTKRLGWFGDYSTGVLVVGAYMASLAWLGPYAFGADFINLANRTDVALFGALTVLFGLAMGYGLRPDAEIQSHQL